MNKPCGDLFQRRLKFIQRAIIIDIDACEFISRITGQFLRLGGFRGYHVAVNAFSVER